MESPKYLIIITLIDGQNFTVPEDSPDKVEATVFAEARFGNESILKSDPIRLTNSNPEFVTELAWQLDKRSLHQLRVERRAIKLQVFLQTKEKRKLNRHKEEHNHHGYQTNDSSPTHKIELIGYTVIDIRSAQETKQPKFSWVPLLNPKFRKSSYNRPEVQLALTLNRLDDEAFNDCDQTSFQSATNSLKVSNQRIDLESLECQSDLFTSDCESSNDDSKLYKTCLDFTLNSMTGSAADRDAIIENDIKIIANNDLIFIYDTKNKDKSTLDDCDQCYKITVTIPFNSELSTLIRELKDDRYYFMIDLFGNSVKSDYFNELTSVETKEVEFDVRTTHASILTTYFELNSNLVIKLYQDSCEEPLGIATIQIDQLCSIDAKRRSLEGIFALQSTSDHDISSVIHPTIGVSVVLEKSTKEETDHLDKGRETISEQLNQDDAEKFSTENLDLAKQHFGEDIDDYLYKTLNDTHQLTIDDTRVEGNATPTENINIGIDGLKQDDHHFCFTIDLKNFSYTHEQRLIPTLRELVVRYSYPFFGYKDTITTDASIPISATNSIIVSGFCEFNFATTMESLLAALRQIPLDLEILTINSIKRLEISADESERKVGMSSLNLAQTLNFSDSNIESLKEKPIDTTVSVPIYGMNGSDIGELQIYLCLKDLGEPSYKFKSSIESLNTCINKIEHQDNHESSISGTQNDKKITEFIADTKSSLEIWKEDFCETITQELKKSENERFKRIYQRLEAKDAKREQDFKKKMDELANLERRYRDSLHHIEYLEKKLSNSFDQMKTKEALLDTRLDTVDLKISKGIESIKLEYEKRMESLPIAIKYQPRNPAEENHIDSRTITRVSSKQSQHQSSATTESNNFQARRSSLRNLTGAAAVSTGIPVRSTSLVRGPGDRATATTTRFVNKPTGMVTTVVNNSRPTKLNLSKETQEKLSSLRKEKAELLKRGCKPNDELIVEINSLIEKLASYSIKNMSV